jgi:TetR/AcrR family transcriptional regulator, mexJK operon transcriptional repressor
VTQPRRERILTAAAKVFAERGYAAASTARIATAAGASKETIYSYFGDKAGLLRETLAWLIAAPDTLVGVPPVDSDTTPAQFQDMLQVAAATLVSDLMQPAYLGLARVVVAETPREPGLADIFRSAVAGRALSGVAQVLSAGQRHGLVDPSLDVQMAARAFVGPLLTYVLLDGLLRPADQIRPPDPPTVRRQVALFGRSIRNTDHETVETS